MPKRTREDKFESLNERGWGGVGQLNPSLDQHHPGASHHPSSAEEGSGRHILVSRFVSEHLEIDFVMRRVRAGDRSIRLTPKEFDLLRYLVSQTGRPISHRELLTAVWGPESAKQIDYLRVLIAYLRKKLEPDPANPQFILTEPWFGYRFLGFDE